MAIGQCYSFMVMNTYLRLTLADNIAALMEKTPALDTQVKLARRSGIAQSSVGRILRGDVSATIDNIEAIATAFGVSISTLLKSHSNSQLDVDDFVGDLPQLLNGLKPGDVDEVRLFIQFIQAKREAAQVGGISHISRIPTDDKRARIVGAMNRPIGEATFESDETKTANQLQNVQRKDRRKTRGS
jgi:transcriptional regulator with XRE-family HTH domain